MSNPFVAEIRMFGFNFAPKGWAQCNGQLLPISQNTALFSLLGTFYGGDGKSTFALPNLEGSVPISQGQGPGLSDRFIGEQSGSEFITLIQTEIPIHSHTMMGNSTKNGLNPTPAPDQILAKSQGGNVYTQTTTSLAQMNFQTLGIAGSSLPHNNMMPYLIVNFCIAMQGVFPPRG
ncbi:MAG TPA: tail fiber protein [Thermoanaerobaculia bacterium]|jgi:microcystin-dependent protein|nr:tail fiber protein [Thermoanaerobaculia bacterium]